MTRPLRHVYRTVVPQRGGIHCTLAARRELAAADVGAGLPTEGSLEGLEEVVHIFIGEQPTSRRRA
jgi:hypothetical protein